MSVAASHPQAFRGGDDDRRRCCGPCIHGALEQAHSNCSHRHVPLTRRLALCIVSTTTMTITMCPVHSTGS